MIRVRSQAPSSAGIADEVWRELRPRAAVAMKDALMLAEGSIKRVLTGQRSGAQYVVTQSMVMRADDARVRPGVGSIHTASAPGEAPAVLFGRLRASITHDGPRWEDDYTLVGEVGTNVEYARRLDQGGTDKRGVYIAPRPFMTPGVEAVRPSIEARLERL